MDSSVVNKEIKAVIRPLLKDAGFTQFTVRTAWRYAGERIDVVNFQSFNSYLANSVGCTTFSFGVNLGCSFNAIPRNKRAKLKDGFFRPEEYECHFRLQLQKTIRQSDLNREDVWFVDSQGQNLNEVMEDARQEIRNTGLSWFNRFHDGNEVLRTLLEDSESRTKTFGMGRENSPNRHYLIGYIAKSLGKAELAKEHMQKALLSGFFKDRESEMRALLA